MKTIEESKIHALLELKPFENNQEKKDKIFLEAMKESLLHHFQNSTEFKKICKKKDFDIEKDFTVEQIPYFPVSIFKKFELISISKEDVFKTIFSSATTSKIPSKIFLDRITSERQTKALVSIMSDFLQEKMDFCILDTKDTNSSSNEVKSRSSAIRGFLPFMNSIKFLLNEDLQINNLELENIQFDEESLALIAASAQGSIRDGLTLLDQAIAHGNGALNSDQVKALLGTIDQSYIIELIKHVAASDGDGAYLALNKITELNVEYEQVLKIIISVFHKISLHQQLQNSEDASIKQLAESIDPQVTQLHYEIALNALHKFHVHPHPKQALELCILRMLAFQPISEGAAPKIEKKNPELATKPTKPKENLAEVTEIQTTEPKEVPPVAEASEKLDAEDSSMPSELDMQSWNSIFNSLNLSMFVSQVFSEFEFVSFADNTLTLKKSDELINPTEGLKTEFLEAISTQLGHKISLIIESGEVLASPAAVEVERAQDQLNQDKDALLENAAVKDILDSFGGKIIDDSIKKVSP